MISPLHRKFFPSSFYSRRSLEMYNDMAKHFPMTGIIVEVGAFRGYTTLLYAKKADKVIAFEADEVSFRELKKRTKSHQNILAVRGGIWEMDTVLTFYGKDVEARGFIPCDDVPDAPIKKMWVKSLDNALHDADARHINLLVIQANGAEVPIIRGSSLKQMDAVCTYSFYDFEGKPCAPQVIELLKERGFNVENKGGRIYARRI